MQIIFQTLIWRTHNHFDYSKQTQNEEDTIAKSKQG
jgi:hypothetical protein